MTPLIGGVLAHVKWFTDPRLHPTEYGLLLTLPVIAAFVLAIAAAGVAYLIQHGVPEPKMPATARPVPMIAMPMPASPQKSSSLTIASVRPVGSA